MNHPLCKTGCERIACMCAHEKLADEFPRLKRELEEAREDREKAHKETFVALKCQTEVLAQLAAAEKVVEAAREYLDQFDPGPMDPFTGECAVDEVIAMREALAAYDKTITKE